MPVDSEIGRLARLTSTGEHAILSQAMSETFDVDWCEKYLAESVRKPITDLYSDFLSSHLPASSFFISEGKAFGETGRSLAVKFSDGKIAEFAVEDKMISVMKTIQRNL